MSIGIDEIDFDDDLTIEENGDVENNNLENGLNPALDEEESEELPSEDNTSENVEITNDLVTYMLNQQGISDPTKIKIEDENGEIKELNFNDLPLEDRINILKGNSNQAEQELDEDEIELINTIRLNKLTPNEYINLVMKKGAEEYANNNQNQEEHYQIDDLSDDELFILDLLSRIEDITDGEAMSILERAKQDSDIYTKLINGIREEYKRIENTKRENEAKELQEKYNQQFEEFSNSIKNSILRFNSIGNLDIDMDEDDKEDVAQFLLTTDGAGVNHFTKLLKDPDSLVKMAWFALKGEDAFNNITDYFVTEIKNREQASYNKGLQDGKLKSTKTNKKVVYQPNYNNNNKNQKLFTIDDLD